MLSVLVSGAGIAGTAFAHFATRAGLKVTVVERARNLRQTGQNVDLNSPAARKIVQDMNGAMERVKAAGTEEKGVLIVDEQLRTWARFPASNSFSMTADPEDRGMLAQILQDATPGVDYILGDSITSLDQLGDSVRVHFEQHTTKTYDLVVAADGLFSNTRRLALQDDHRCVSLYGQYMAYFSYPIERSICSDMWCRWHNTTGRRQVILRPSKHGLTHASVAVFPTDDRLEGSHRLPIEEQKQRLARYFDRAQGPAVEAIEEMRSADDFYMGAVGQVRLDRYSSGRIVFIGDAGMAPSVYSGMGVSLAVVGGYVLAGELQRALSPNGELLDVQPALNGFEGVMHPFAEQVQHLFLGQRLPRLVNPASWGLIVLRSLAAIFSRLAPVLSWFGSGEETDPGLKLPEYFPIEGKMGVKTL